MAELIKDPSIHALLAELRARLGPRGWEVVDDWDADLCAIGLARTGEQYPLVYISTWQQPQGKYFASLEGPPQPGSDEP